MSSTIGEVRQPGQDMPGTLVGVEPTRMLLSDDVEVVAHRSPGWDPDRTVAVLLHGIGMTHRTWERMQPRLASALPVVSLDQPGFADTRKPGRPFGVTDHAAAADAALERLGVGRRVLVGHSMGAQFAIAQAILRPGTVAGIVLVGPVVDDAHRTLGSQARRLGLDTLREPLRANLRVLVDYFRGGVGWYLVTLKAMFDYATEEHIAEVTCPVVVVRGEHDPVARDAWCRRLVAAVPGRSELVTVPGVAHVVPQTAPAALAGVVADLAASAG